MSWVLARWADHAVRLGAVWARFVQHHAKHRWFDLFVAFLFGLLAPPILESHAFLHLVQHIGLGGIFHHAKEGS
jgi:hypothetical protein